MSYYENVLSTLRDRFRLSVGSYHWQGGQLHISGWNTSDNSYLRVRGGQLVSYSGGLPKKGMAELFRDHSVTNSGFTAIVEPRPEPGDHWRDYVVVYPTATAEIEIANSWAFPLNEIRLSIPDGEKINRVTGSSTAYIHGGASHAYRMLSAIEHFTRRKPSSFSNVIDWGCGAARISQHLLTFWPDITGADVDPVNLNWCRNNVTGLNTYLIPWEPPTNLPSQAYDLLLAFSVFSHIHNDRIAPWLEEIHRLLARGGIAAITTLGVTSTASRKAPESFYDKLEHEGFVQWPNKGQIDDIRPRPEDYLNIAVTTEFMKHKLDKYFEICGLIEGLGPQDAWIVRKL